MLVPFLIFFFDRPMNKDDFLGQVRETETPVEKKVKCAMVGNVPNLLYINHHTDSTHVGSIRVLQFIATRGLFFPNLV